MTAGISSRTSATGGYLAPTSAAPADDLALDVLLQGLVAGVTGLAGSLVLPRWQEDDDASQAARPRNPDRNTNWCAVGATVTTKDDTPAQIHHSDGNGFTVLRRFEMLDVLASFYGPDGNAFASMMADGLYLAQNREAMQARGMTLIGVDPIRRLPEIIATGTRRRSDFGFRLTRRVERTYPILNVLQGVGDIQANANTADGPVIVTTPFTAPEN